MSLATRCSLLVTSLYHPPPPPPPPPPPEKPPPLLPELEPGAVDEEATAFDNEEPRDDENPAGLKLSQLEPLYQFGR